MCANHPQRAGGLLRQSGPRRDFGPFARWSLEPQNSGFRIVCKYAVHSHTIRTWKPPRWQSRPRMVHWHSHDRFPNWGSTRTKILGTMLAVTAPTSSILHFSTMCYFKSDKRFGDEANDANSNTIVRTTNWRASPKFSNRFLTASSHWNGRKCSWCSWGKNRPTQFEFGSSRHRKRLCVMDRRFNSPKKSCQAPRFPGWRRRRQNGSKLSRQRSQI